MTEWQPIETAPGKEVDFLEDNNNPEILVYSRWDWDGADGENCDPKYSWRVAKYGEEGIWTVTSNPYKDKAFDPKYWMPLSEAPKTESL
jgi:hypothetical protein